MHVTELNRDQIIELKQSYVLQLEEDGSLNDILDIDTVSWGTLANVDEIVPDDVIFSNYDGVCFVEDDFFCAAE